MDAAGNESALSLAVSVTIDTAAPAVPAAPDLQAASDTGISGTDNITADNTPTFTVAGAPFFRFYRGGAKLSGDYQSGASYTTAAQTDGTYLYQVSAVDAAGNESAFSPGLSVTIDTTTASADVVNVTPDPRSTPVSSLAIVFSEAVAGFDLANLTLKRDGGSNLLTGSRPSRLRTTSPGRWGT